ncbi:sugar transferase [Tsuneonella sp. SYSU-LHT278]|uniref:sugar transferase n=1 Tax=Tsuneonella sediminis TaxID=3416089 RepID=UPI003F7974DA
MRTPSPFRRACELALAIPAAVLALPAVVALLIAVRVETPGAPLLVQRRVGRGRKPFRLFKIRTMFRDTPHVASHEVGEMRVTRLGAVLRRLKLDELPQLINIINGTMSFVGPRPCLPEQAELIAERERRGLFALRPGVTGPGQVAGIDMSTPVLLAETEAQYFRDSTLSSDLGILVRTALGSGRGDAASRRGA